MHLRTPTASRWEWVHVCVCVCARVCVRVCVRVRVRARACVSSRAVPCSVPCVWRVTVSIPVTIMRVRVLSFHTCLRARDTETVFMADIYKVALVL